MARRFTRGGWFWQLKPDSQRAFRQRYSQRYNNSCRSAVIEAEQRDNVLRRR